MISILILLFAETKSQVFKIPKFFYLHVVKKGEESKCNIFVDMDQIKGTCHLNPESFGGPERCNLVVDSFIGFKCFSTDEVDTIDSALSQVDSSTEFLYLVQSVSANIRVDFNKLPRQMGIYYAIYK